MTQRKRRITVTERVRRQLQATAPHGMTTCRCGVTRPTTSTCRACGYRPARRSCDDCAGCDRCLSTLDRLNSVGGR